MKILNSKKLNSLFKIKFLPFSKRSNSRSDFARYNSIFPKSNRSQITLFIILGIVLVAAIILIFLLKTPPKSEIINEKDPQSYIELCAKDAAEKAIKILSEQGGDIDPKGSVMHLGKNITYLCYNSNFYLPCINQRPLLIEHIEKEINDYIAPKIFNCFEILKSSLQNNGYEIWTGEMQIITKLKPGQVIININRNFKMSRENSIKEYNDFGTGLIHPIYNFAEIAMEIVNQQSRFCNFNALGFMIIYPNYDLSLEPVAYADGTGYTIYAIKERGTNREFKFAIRSCALPPGF